MIPVESTGFFCGRDFQPSRKVSSRGATLRHYFEVGVNSGKDENGGEHGFESSSTAGWTFSLLNSQSVLVEPRPCTYRMQRV